MFSSSKEKWLNRKLFTLGRFLSTNTQKSLFIADYKGLHSHFALCYGLDVFQTVSYEIFVFWYHDMTNERG